MFEETGLRTQAMCWVDCCLAAGKMWARKQEAEIRPAVRAVLEDFDAGPGLVQDLLLQVLKQTPAVRRGIPRPIWN